MRIAQGSIEHDAGEMDALVHEYYATTVASTDMPPLEFNWATYGALELADAAKVFTARDDERLLGFALYIVQTHLHHRRNLFAHCQLLSVRPECRSQGIGRGLVEAAETWFRAHGVSHLIHHYRTIYNTVPLFERLGFRLEAVDYVKEL